MTEHVAILRCQTWNVWPERTVIGPYPIRVALPDAAPIDSQLAVMAYDNRSEPVRYASEGTKLGPLVWDGTVPGLYLVRDTVIKAPEDTVEVAIPFRQANRGEIDICINFRSEHSPPPPEVLEAVRATLYATLSAINLRLDDYVTPSVPPQVKSVSSSGASGEAKVLLAVRSRRLLSSEEVACAITGMVQAFQRSDYAEKLRTALELHAAHFNERQARVRFLLLVTAMEALSQATPKHPAAAALLARWEAELREELSRHDPASEAHASLSALLREMNFRGSDSIRSQLRKLFERVPVAGPAEAHALGRRVLRLYDQRSVLVHEGHIPHQDLLALEAEARELLERLLQSLLAEAPLTGAA